jgi:hypothetical protein
MKFNTYEELTICDVQENVIAKSEELRNWLNKKKTIFQDKKKLRFLHGTDLT